MSSPLVRLVMRSWLQEKGELEEWTTIVVQRLEEEYPYPDHENRKTWTGCLPHGQALLDIDGAINTERVSKILRKIAGSYDQLGKYSEAERLYRQNLDISERVLGREHPDTLTSMNNLALTLDYQGKHEEAEKINRQTLEISERVLGKEHPDTLTSMHNLASTLSDQGKDKEAEKLFRQTLELREKVLGREHPRTLDTLNGLVYFLRKQGKYDEAEEILALKS